MPPVKLADTRTMTIDDTRRTLEALAHCQCTIASREARAEARIAAIKSACAAELAETRSAQAQYEAVLTAYILAHPDQFQRPRTVRTEFGEFGLRRVSNIEISDPDAAVQFVLDRGYPDCVETMHRLQKPALRERIKSGEAIPGCELRTGEEAFYKIDKAMLDAAGTIATEA